MTDELRAAAAAALWEADQTKVPIAPLTETWPELDVVDAYEIQRANIGRRVDAGARVRGHKVGLSAKAMQDMLGVHEPDYGHLLDDMFCFEHDVDPHGPLLPAPGRDRGGVRARRSRSKAPG